MVIIAKKILTEYAERHAEAGESLERWYNHVIQANWNTLADIRKDFNSVDFVGNDRYVFNIKGNHFRLIAMIHFSVRTVYIKFIGTHAEYDKIDVSTINIR